MTKENLQTLIDMMERNVSMEEKLLQYHQAEVARFKAKREAEKMPSDKILYNAIKEDILQTQQHIQNQRNSIAVYRKMIQSMP